MSVNVAKLSRLRFADLRTLDGVEFWDFVDLPPYQSRSGDLQYTVKTGDRIDLLAFTFYRDPVAWWVIAWANDIELVPTQLKEGASLVIPDPNYVLTKLFTMAGR